MKNRFKIRRLVVTGVLSGIILLLGSTPLGLIPVPPLAMTTLHLPVILGAILEGPVVGMILGAVFGVFSCLRAIFVPTSPVTILFAYPWVSVLPRVLIGLVAYFTFQGLKKLFKAKKNPFTDMIPAAGAAIAGTLFNSIGVLGMLYIFHAKEYVSLMPVLEQTSGVATFFAIFATFFTNGLPEAAVAAVVIVALERALRTIYKKERRLQR